MTLRSEVGDDDGSMRLSDYNIMMSVLQCRAGGQGPCECSLA